MKIKYLQVATVTLFVGLTACTNTPPEEQLRREMAGVTGKSANFTQGYHDGCQSGLSAAGNKAFVYAKDLKRANQSEYKLGWEDGFRVCKSRQTERNREHQAPDSFPYFLPRTGVTIGVQL